MAVSSHDTGPFLSAEQYFDALSKLSEKEYKEHADYMDFAELYGDYVAAFEKGQPDSYLNSLRMSNSIQGI